MNFFQEIKEIIGDKTITISVTAEGERLTVISLPRAKNDEPLIGFVPLCLSGTADQLDAGFMNSLAKSVEVLNGLQSNISEVEKSTVKTKSESALTSGKKSRTKKKAEISEEEKPSGTEGLPFSDSDDEDANAVFDDIKVDSPAEETTTVMPPSKPETAGRPIAAVARPISQAVKPSTTHDVIDTPKQENSQLINDENDEW